MQLSPKLAKIAKLAEAHAVEQSKTVEHRCKVGSDYYLNLERAKFAELIINECMWQVLNEPLVTKPAEIALGNRFAEAFGIDK